MSFEYTIVLTSCGRFDLLRESLKSLLEMVDTPPKKILLIEDSADASVIEVVSGLKFPVTCIVNDQNLGQMKSIDKVYALVDTEYVFHTQDDWQFTRTGFIQESLTILQSFPEVSMVGLRARSEINPRVRNEPIEHVDGVPFFRHDPKKHPEFFGYSFNPGLRRMSDYQLLAPLEKLGNEGDVSYKFKRNGFHVANLKKMAVYHIGWDRHVDDPKLAKRQRKFWGKLKRSIKKRIKRVKRKFTDD